MPVYLLDTNVCIRRLNNSSSQVIQKLQTTPNHDIAACSIIKAEMFSGSLRSVNPTKSLAIQRTFLAQFISFPFDDKAADFYSEVNADLYDKGTSISPKDVMLAAIALA